MGCMVLTFMLGMMMRTLDKDFKNLKLPDYETDFASGFMTALVLVVGILKMFGVI
jgi:hypothetical protein